MATRKIVVLNLKEIADQMDAHYSAMSRDDVTGQCSECIKEDRITTLGQDVNTCRKCGAHVVWMYSPLWKELFGDPKMILRELKSIEPTTESGKLLFKRAGLSGWATKTEEQAWHKAVKMFGEFDMKNVANYVTQGKRGRPAIAHAINTAKAKVRSGKVSKKPAKAPDSGEREIGLDL